MEAAAPACSDGTDPAAAPTTLARVVQEGNIDPVGTESDETTKTEDNSLGRLLTLSDGVFAIAMTLLTLDLKVPDLGANPGDRALRHALAHNGSAYLSFLVSFYVIASYWQRHRRLMRAVVASHPRLVRDTILLLLIVAAMPFLTSLLSEYGGTPISLALYGGFNALAILTLMQIRRDVRRFDLLGGHVDDTEDAAARWGTWRSLVTFILCIPAGYIFGHNGPWLLAVLAVPMHVPLVAKLKQRLDRRRMASAAP